MFKFTQIALACIVALGIAKNASAAIIPTSADTFVQRGSATTNNGAGTAILIKNNATASTDGTDRVSFVSFDLSSAESTITDAILRLTRTGNTTGTSGTVQVFGIPDLAAGEIFVEGNGGTDNLPTGELRFDNAGPFVDPSDNSVNEANLTLLGSFTTLGTVGTNFTNDFSSPELITFLNADTNNVATFVLTLSTAATGFVPNFHSKENILSATPPTLLTNAEAIPEPGTFAMLLLGGIGLAVAARRRR